MRFDRGYQLGNDARMSGLAKKIIAVFFAVWLPLFSGSVLAASVQMASHHHCQDEMMADMDMSGHHMSGADDEQNPTCDACAVCHLACTGYLAVPGVGMTTEQTLAHDVTPYLLAFHSFTSTPLLPPPLARV